MIVAYSSSNNFKAEMVTAANQHIIKTALWLDLLNPTLDEESMIEEVLKLDVPTKAEMREIELSSRLYIEDNVLFMTVMMVEKSDTAEPKSDAVTLILTSNQLLTVRYVEPQSFAVFASHLPKLSPSYHNATSLLIELLDSSVDRLADILENVSARLDDYSQAIFHSKIGGKPSERIDYKSLMEKIGATGDLNGKVQESLTSFNRLVTFYRKKSAVNLQKSVLNKLTMLAKDTTDLRDHVQFLSNKVTFMLDATLGMVNIEQNEIIKIFSIAAVVLLPPTLVASIYGMNFEFMPELKWHFGYPFAITMMIVSALLPYQYFKMKKWL